MNNEVKTETPKVELKTFREYALATTRTLNAKGEEFDALHFSSGIASEYLELLLGIKKQDYINCIEEFGDMFWYIGNKSVRLFPEDHLFWSKLNKIWFEKYAELTLTKEDALDGILISVEKLVDAFKREGAYGKRINEYETIVQQNIISLALNAQAFIHTIDPTLPIHQILERNIQKLYDRYPDKFDQFFAFNRDLEKERKTLEGN